MKISQQLQCESLPNLRDLGGMEGADGKHIRSGVLLRSEQLFNASPKDMAALAGLPLRLIVDFRNPKEAVEKPDPVIPGSKSLHLSIIDDSTLISWEKDKSEQGKQQIEMAQSDSQAGARGMCELYRNFIRMPYSRAQYARFMYALLDTEEGAVLWHCTLGKDRCGWGTALVQAVLGVSREAILADYLYTNECLKEEISGMMEMLKKISSQTTLANAGLALVEARREYLLSAWDEAEKCYGSMDGFLEQGIGVDASMRKKLRAKYLV